jgi:hypothetical protein
VPARRRPPPVLWPLWRDSVFDDDDDEEEALLRRDSEPEFGAEWLISLAAAVVVVVVVAVVGGGDEVSVVRRCAAAKISLRARNTSSSTRIVGSSASSRARSDLLAFFCPNCIAIYKKTTVRQLMVELRSISTEIRLLLVYVGELCFELENFRVGFGASARHSANIAAQHEPQRVALRLHVVQIVGQIAHKHLDARAILLRQLAGELFAQLAQLIVEQRLVLPHLALLRAQASLCIEIDRCDRLEIDAMRTDAARHGRAKLGRHRCV